ncbi:MAG: hypothetical protein U0T84_01910 [Chitinophagales bacterium]
MEKLGDIALICAPLLIVCTGVIFLIQKFLQRDKELRLLELRMAESKDTRLLRLQAYERMVLLLERMAPGAVISRVIEPDMLSSELQLAIVKSIRSEFEHNLSQQLYISSNAWNLAVSARDETVKTISLIAAKVPVDATANQLARTILEAFSNAGQLMPSQTALEFLKEEARELM